MDTRIHKDGVESESGRHRQEVNVQSKSVNDTTTLKKCMCSYRNILRDGKVEMEWKKETQRPTVRNRRGMGRTKRARGCGMALQGNHRRDLRGNLCRNQRDASVSSEGGVWAMWAVWWAVWCEDMARSRARRMQPTYKTKRGQCQAENSFRLEQRREEEMTRRQFVTFVARGD
ncbi:uncharacterized protein SPSK_10590 [Sporothrix schenckii 1099-18]|uniref:Uncharacterized protein n=1 Tax=Sporothrix schenckii 1099-18 TaxID=1397361 RepID=A0A0F2M297_SPOSC|nr:uncharacterized protein SPSK_10590 [Sporothrix schenckii 1099-18]KJR82880.1 hypothetical protein SPSK_10590 [Sporothrix schenckii 1099-18]